MIATKKRLGIFLKKKLNKKTKKTNGKLENIYDARIKRKYPILELCGHHSEHKLVQPARYPP